MSLSAKSRDVLKFAAGPRVHETGYKSITFKDGATIHIPVWRDDPSWLKEHIAYRVRIHEFAEKSDAHKGQLLRWCAESPVFWFNTFVWTYRQKKTFADGIARALRRGESRHEPFCLWPVQEELVEAIINAIDKGEDLGIDKSRDMGASWTVLGTFHWIWLFRPDTTLGEMSRKAELVDAPDSRSLFWKHDYINKYLPPWMLPRIRRSKMRILNLDNNCEIVGETTGPDAGQASRGAAFLIDEASRIREFESVFLALADTVDTRIPTSTPKGPTYFSKIVTDGSIPVKIMHWTRHPEKSRDLEMGPHPKFPSRRTLINAFFKRQCKRRSKRDVAENLDIDHTAAGAQFFDRHNLLRHMQEFAREPRHVGIVRLAHDTPTESIPEAVQNKWGEAFEFVSGAGGGKLRLWCDLTMHNGVMRPPQSRTYVMGGDISHGLEASESTMIIVDHNTGEQVGELAASDLSPDEFAQLCAMVGIWFGGSRGCAFIAWEANGVGQRFGRQLVRRLGYPWYYRHREDKTASAKQSDRLGWTSNEEAKIDVLGELARAQELDEFITRSARLLDQQDGYVWFESRLAVGTGLMEDATADARALHGDLVIGAAVCQHARRLAPKMLKSERKPIAGTLSDRIAGTPEGRDLGVAQVQRLRSLRGGKRPKRPRLE